MLTITRKKTIVAIALFAVVALSIISGNSLVERAIAQSTNQKIVMVTSADYPPYEFRDTASGKNEIIGFDVDIAKYITKELGLELSITDTDFNGIIPALQSKRADFAMAGMTPTAERKKTLTLAIFTTTRKIQLLV